MSVPRSVRSFLFAVCALSALALSGCSTLSIAISPDGKRIAYSANQGSPLYVQEIGSNNPPKWFDVGEAYGLAWSPDGKSLAIASAPGMFSMMMGDQSVPTASILNIETGKLRKLSTKLNAPLAWADDHTVIGCQQGTSSDASSILPTSTLAWLNLSTGKIDRNLPLTSNATHLTRIGESSSFLVDSDKAVFLVDTTGAKPITKEGDSFLAFTDGQLGGYVIKESKEAPGNSEVLYRWTPGKDLEPLSLPKGATGIATDYKSYDSIVSISPSGKYLVVQHWDDLSPKPLLPQLMKLGLEGKSGNENTLNDKAEAKKLYDMLTSPTNKFQVDYRLVERETGKISSIATRVDKMLPFAVVQAAWSSDEKSLGLTSELSDISETWLIDPATAEKKSLVTTKRPGPFAMFLPVLSAASELKNTDIKPPAPKSKANKPVPQKLKHHKG